MYKYGVCVYVCVIIFHAYGTMHLLFMCLRFRMYIFKNNNKLPKCYFLKRRSKTSIPTKRHRPRRLMSAMTSWMDDDNLSLSFNSNTTQTTRSKDFDGASLDNVIKTVLVSTVCRDNRVALSQLEWPYLSSIGPSQLENQSYKILGILHLCIRDIMKYNNAYNMLLVASVMQMFGYEKGIDEHASTSCLLLRVFWHTFRNYIAAENRNPHFIIVSFVLAECFMV